MVKDTMAIDQIKQIVIVLLFASLIVVGGKYYYDLKTFRQASVLIAQQAEKEKVIDFLKLFTNKVLEGVGEVSFDDRLQLENAVRDMDDSNIFKIWQDFTNSKDENRTQKNLKKLLGTLIRKL